MPFRRYVWGGAVDLKAFKAKDVFQIQKSKKRRYTHDFCLSFHLCISIVFRHCAV